MASTTELERLSVVITADVKGIESALNSLSKNANDNAGKIQRSLNTINFDQFSKALENTQQKLTNFGNKAGIFLTAPLALLGKQAISAASDMNELQSKFQQVFKELTPAATEWADVTGEAVNRSKLDFMDYLSTLQAVFSGMGFARGEAAELSKSLALLGVDLASFHNTADPDAVRDLTSAITGEHETVKKYGVLLNDASLDQELFNMGIQGGTKDATELQKVLARFNVIMNSTKDAQGDAARTSEGFANQLRGMQSELREASAAMGQALLPAALDIVKVVTNLAEGFNGLSEGTKTFVVEFGVVAAVLSPVALGLNGLITIVSSVTTGLAALGVTFGTVLAAGPWIAAAAAIGGVVYWLTDLNAEAQKNEPLNSLEQNLKDVKSITDDLTFATKQEAKANLEAALAITEKTKALIREKQAQVQSLGAERVEQTETFPNFRTGESGTVLSETGISNVSKDILGLNEALKETEDHAAKVQNILDNWGTGGGGSNKPSGGVSGDSGKSGKGKKSTATKDAGKTLDDFQKQIDMQLKLAEAAKISSDALALEEERQAILNEGFKGSNEQLMMLAEARIKAREALGEGKEELDAIKQNEDLRKALEAQIALNYKVAESAKAMGATQEQANKALGYLEGGFKGSAEEAINLAGKVEESEKALDNLATKTIPQTNKAFENMFDRGLESIERKLIEGTGSWRDILLDWSKDLQMDAFRNLNSIAKQFIFGQGQVGGQQGGGDGGLLGSLLGAFGGGSGDAGIADVVSGDGITPDFSGYYATGGDIKAGRAAVVGENGGEFIVPKQDMHVFSNAQSRMMSGAGRGGVRNQQVNINFMLPSNSNFDSFMTPQSRSAINRMLQSALSRASRDI